jgi:hypothetical protein
MFGCVGAGCVLFYALVQYGLPMPGCVGAGTIWALLNGVRPPGMGIIGRHEIAEKNVVYILCLSWIIYVEKL